MHRTICRIAVVSLAIIIITAARLVAGEPAAIKDTQPETIKLTTPEEAARSITVPDEFKVSLFAAEPDVRQPIAMTTDSRGRLWVAENNTYAEKPTNFDLSQHDRIIILEDADHDGRASAARSFGTKPRN